MTFEKGNKVRVIGTQFPEYRQWVTGQTATVKRFIKARGTYLIELDDDALEPVMWELRESSIARVQS
jgi:hypothetical protein